MSSGPRDMDPSGDGPVQPVVAETFQRTQSRIRLAFMTFFLQLLTAVPVTPKWTQVFSEFSVECFHSIQLRFHELTIFLHIAQQNEASPVIMQLQS